MEICLNNKPDGTLKSGIGKKQNPIPDVLKNYLNLSHVINLMKFYVHFSTIQPRFAYLNDVLDSWKISM